MTERFAPGGVSLTVVTDNRSDEVAIAEVVVAERERIAQAIEVAKVQFRAVPPISGAYTVPVGQALPLWAQGVNMALETAARIARAAPTGEAGA